MYDESVLDEISTLGEAIAAANSTTAEALSAELVDRVLGVRSIPAQQRDPD